MTPTDTPAARLAPEDAKLRERMDRIRREVESYNGSLSVLTDPVADMQFMLDMLNVAACSFCGFKSTKQDTQAIADHMLTCEKHPFAIVRAANEMLADDALKTWELLDAAGIQHADDDSPSMEKIPISERVRIALAHAAALARELEAARAELAELLLDTLQEHSSAEADGWLRGMGRSEARYAGKRLVELGLAEAHPDNADGSRVNRYRILARAALSPPPSPWAMNYCQQCGIQLAPDDFDGVCSACDREDELDPDAARAELSAATPAAEGTELAQLRQIFGGLPRTVDGVPIVPGRDYWRVMRRGEVGRYHSFAADTVGRDRMYFDKSKADAAAEAWPSASPPPSPPPGTDAWDSLCPKCEWRGNDTGDNTCPECGQTPLFERMEDREEDPASDAELVIEVLKLAFILAARNDMPQQTQRILMECARALAPPPGTESTEPRGCYFPDCRCPVIHGAIRCGIGAIAPTPAAATPAAAGEAKPRRFKHRAGGWDYVVEVRGDAVYFVNDDGTEEKSQHLPVSEVLRCVRDGAWVEVPARQDAPAGEGDK